MTVTLFYFIVRYRWKKCCHWKTAFFLNSSKWFIAWPIDNDFRTRSSWSNKLICLDSWWIENFIISPLPVPFLFSLSSMFYIIDSFFYLYFLFYSVIFSVLFYFSGPFVCHLSLIQLFIFDELGFIFLFLFSLLLFWWSSHPLLSLRLIVYSKKIVVPRAANKGRKSILMQYTAILCEKKRSALIYRIFFNSTTSEENNDTARLFIHSTTK